QPLNLGNRERRRPIGGRICNIVGRTYWAIQGEALVYRRQEHLPQQLEMCGDRGGRIALRQEDGLDPREVRSMQLANRPVDLLLQELADIVKVPRDFVMVLLVAADSNDPEPSELLVAWDSRDRRRSAARALHRQSGLGAALVFF